MGGIFLAPAADLGCNGEALWDQSYFFCSTNLVSILFFFYFRNFHRNIFGNLFRHHFRKRLLNPLGNLIGKKFGNMFKNSIANPFSNVLQIQHDYTNTNW